MQQLAEYMFLNGSVILVRVKYMSKVMSNRGCPTTSTDNGLVAEEVGIFYSSYWAILTEDLGVKLVPQLLTQEQKEKFFSVTSALLECVETDESLLKDIIRVMKHVSTVMFPKLSSSHQNGNSLTCHC
jgi:hypothetical protein